jgi:hypothetical protein
VEEKFIISSSILETLLTIILRAKHRDLWPEDINKFVTDVKAGVEKYQEKTE